MAALDCLFERQDDILTMVTDTGKQMRTNNASS